MKKVGLLLGIPVLASASAAVGGGPKTEAEGPVVMSGSLFDSGTPLVSPAANDAENLYLVNRTYTDDEGVVHHDSASRVERKSGRLRQPAVGLDTDGQENQLGFNLFSGIQYHLDAIFRFLKTGATVFQNQLGAA